MEEAWQGAGAAAGQQFCEQQGERGGSQDLDSWKGPGIHQQG